MKWRNLSILGLPLLAVAVLAGCNHNDDKGRVSYEVTVTNLSEAQPLSPPALILHRGGYQPWQVGSAASGGLEQLAEGGSTEALLAEAAAHPEVKATAADTAVILPGASSSVIIKSRDYHDLSLSLAAMLVNTNDGFTGVNAEPVGSLAWHGRRHIELMAYDAGTEANSESAATVPGPAAGGEGYNGARDDRDTVGGHPGVVSADDGLAGSALNASHRFDNPVARVTITRLQ
jgi:hypothetical protein